MHGKNRFPIYFTDICDAGYMGNFYGIIAACGGGGAGISVGISHACALIRNTSVFHISPGLHPEKIPLGIRLSLTGTKNQEKDQVTPYSALATALAATIGTGNIVEFPQPLPSADRERVFWCWLTGVFGIATCYAECYLSIRYRVRRADNTFAGGPMYILDRRLKKKENWQRRLRCLRCLRRLASAAACSHTPYARRSSIRLPCRRIWSEWRSGCLQGLLSSGKQPDCKGVYVARPADERFFMWAAVSIFIGRNRAVLPETLALIFSSAVCPKAVAGGCTGGALLLGIQTGVSPGIVYQ